MTDQEFVVTLENGNTIRTGGAKESKYLVGNYVRVCNPDGMEIQHWDCQDWKDDPICIMGIILTCAGGQFVKR